MAVNVIKGRVKTNLSLFVRLSISIDSNPPSGKKENE